MFENNLELQNNNSHLSGDNQRFIECLYEIYLSDPNSLSEQWLEYFKNISDGKQDISHAKIIDQFKGFTSLNSSNSVKEESENMSILHAKITRLIHAYRLHGHQHAQLDPLNIAERKIIPDLNLEHYGLNNNLDSKIEISTSLISSGSRVRDLYDALIQTYSNTIGVEFLHITDNEQTEWIESSLEKPHGKLKFSVEEKKFILKQLTAAEGMEKYLGTKYVGQKRFSLEGGESLIPAMNNLIARAGSLDVKEIIIGMAHRGRLNVLVNVLGKTPESLFEEFEGKFEKNITGDVKYHMGFSADVEVPTGQVVHLGLAFNPSHLEIISPVVEGSVRARQRRRDDLDQHQVVVPVLIHGDAAIAGQGVVMETMNFSQSRGYSVGGTIHIIINNQIGFTTSNPLDARSTLYCSDIAKVIQAPIFHVNADDPEAVLFVTKVAFDFRMKFNKDVVIDLVCYRRHGHNEADDPSVTQPQMYKAIKSIETTRAKYAKKLIDEKVISASEDKKLISKYRDALDQGDSIVKSLVSTYVDEKALNWEPYLNKTWQEKAITSIEKTEIFKLYKKLTNIPKDFALHSAASKIIQTRIDMSKGDKLIDWGFAETMAYASLLEDGYEIRISGQDSGRGTFSHRHAVFHDINTGMEYIPLQELSTQFTVINSVLSEEAVLAFEYGFALADPNGLVIWEAQFGDFANGAQVVIDQFISSGEQKWGRLCGLTLYLPHGFEGQGPEHSSARLERFLQLCAQDNIQVCVPTTPSQMFHLIRRQMIRPYRKPLIIMTPKSLLRHKLAKSTIDDLSSGNFQLIIPENLMNFDKVTKVILCSGKIYYDLYEQRGDVDTIAILRIEQLYPFPTDNLKKLLNKYSAVKDIVWCQEEPKNQGSWSFIYNYLIECMLPGQSLKYIGREISAAPAEGSVNLHKKSQEEIIRGALS